MTKLLTIDLRSTAPRMLGSRGTPSQFVLYGLKNMCAKFDAFTRFVTIFPLTDRTISDEKNIPGYDPEIRKLELRLQLAQLENKTVSLQLSLK